MNVGKATVIILKACETVTKNCVRDVECDFGHSFLPKLLLLGLEVRD